MIKWCLSCCAPTVPDIDINLKCRSACCTSNTCASDTEMNSSPQAKRSTNKKVLRKKHDESRKEEETIE